MKHDIQCIRKSIEQIEIMMGLLIEKQTVRPSVSNPLVLDTPPEEELMTIREAYLELNVSRTTIDKLRRQGALTSVYFNNQVRLLRVEVLAAKTWYSQLKGKR